MRTDAELALPALIAAYGDDHSAVLETRLAIGALALTDSADVEGCRRFDELRALSLSRDDLSGHVLAQLEAQPVCATATGR